MADPLRDAARALLDARADYLDSDRLDSLTAEFAALRSELDAPPKPDPLLALAERMETRAEAHEWKDTSYDRGAADGLKTAASMVRDATEER